MYKFCAFMSVVLLVAAAGCSILPPDHDAPWADVFEVHAQGGYDQTPVRLELDGHVILDDTITTGAVLAVASVVPVEVRQGRHHLRAVVDHSVAAETTFVVGDSLYMAVNYFPDSESIDFWARQTPFPYR